MLRILSFQADARKHRRTLVAQILVLSGFAFWLQHAQAQADVLRLETATSLDTLVAQLGAAAAQKSSYLLVDLPELTIAGETTARLKSEIPGTALLVLARGRFNPTGSLAAPQQPPPGAPRLRAFQGEKAAPVRGEILIAAFELKAGESTRRESSFPVLKTEFVTLFAFAQGGWWYVTRQVKVGMPVPSGAQP